MYWVAIEIVVQNVKFLSLFLLLFLRVSWPGSEVSVSNTVRGLAAGGCIGAKCFWKCVGGRLCCGADGVGTQSTPFSLPLPL